MSPQETADFCVQVLYRASRDAWICGDDAEAERLAALAYRTRLDMAPVVAVPSEVTP
jgi:hypothetical protein